MNEIGKKYLELLYKVGKQTPEVTMIKVCQICGCDFKIKPSQLQKRKTCSKECQGKLYQTSFSGNNNPAFGKTYCTKETHPEWAENIKVGTKGINAGDDNAMKRPEVRRKMSQTRKSIMTPEFRQKIADSVSNAWAEGKYDGVRVGQCKWFNHTMPGGKIVKVQGTWERAFVEWADKQGLFYTCHRGRIPYVDENGHQRSYYPDFFVNEWDCWVDVKNEYHFNLQKSKFLMIEQSNPDLKLKILRKKELVKLGVL